MPFVNIRITKEGHVGKKEKAQLIQGVTKLLAETLGKNRSAWPSPRGPWQIWQSRS